MKQLDNSGAPLLPRCGCVPAAINCIWCAKIRICLQFLVALSTLCLPFCCVFCLLLCLLICPPATSHALPPPLSVSKVNNNASDSMSVPQASRRRCNSCHASNRERATRVSPCKFSIIIVTFGQAQQQLQEILLCVHLSGRQIRKQHCQHGFRWGAPFDDFHIIHLVISMGRCLSSSLSLGC